MSLVRRTIALGLAAACTLLPAVAQAELGRPLASVATDRSRMRAQMSSVAMGRYTRHELTRPNGGMVHEYTNADGAVFAVTWSGPGKPDLSALLGGYFPTYQANRASTARNMHALRHPPQIDQADLQIQAGGHMGWFHGIAFVPSLAPEGFSPGDLSPRP